MLVLSIYLSVSHTFLSFCISIRPYTDLCASVFVRLSPPIYLSLFIFNFFSSFSLPSILPFFLKPLLFLAAYRFMYHSASIYTYVYSSIHLCLPLSLHLSFLVSCFLVRLLPPSLVTFHFTINPAAHYIALEGEEIRRGVTGREKGEAWLNILIKSARVHLSLPSPPPPSPWLLTSQLYFTC